MPKVANCVRNNVIVSLGQSPPSSPDCPIWSITAPGNRQGQVHPSVTAGTTYNNYHTGPRKLPEDVYKVNPNGALQVENPAFYDTESSGYPTGNHHHHHLRPFKTFSPSSSSGGTLKKQPFHQQNQLPPPPLPPPHHFHHLSGVRTSSTARLEKRSWLRWWKLRFRKKTKASDGGPSTCHGCCCCGNNVPHHGRRTRCPVAVAVGVAILLILLVLGVAVVLYLTVGGGLQAFTDEADTEGCWAVEGEFRITNRAYISDMSDPNTSSFGALASEVIRSLDELFLQSSLVRDYNGSDIISLRHGSVVVTCRIFLNRPVLNAASQVGFAFTHGLNQGHGSLPRGNLQVDITNIKFTDLKGNIPPPKSSHEIAILDVAWSQWSDWSSCKDISGNCNPKLLQTRSRDCRIDKGYGDALPNVDACRKLGGTKIEDRGCVCHQPDALPEETFEEAAHYSSHGGSFSKKEQEKLVPSRKLNPVVSDIFLPTTTVTYPVHQFTKPPPSTSLPHVSSSSKHPSSVELTTLSTLTSKKPSIKEVFSATTTKASLPSPSSMPKYNGYRRYKTGSTCRNCGADQICLLSADSSEPQCTSPRDSSDPRGCGGWCESHELCRKIDSTVFKCMDASECYPGEWKCDDGLCIPEIRRCDGHFNCYDSSDERKCNCKADEFHCGDETSCLPLTAKCNGHIDCWDGGDEDNCTSLCPANQHTCNNGQCIAKDFFCDRFKDCQDGSDEPDGCDAPCSTDLFQCANKRCISKVLVCNSADNCGDRSDERLCQRPVLSEPTMPTPSTEVAPISHPHVTRHSSPTLPHVGSNVREIPVISTDSKVTQRPLVWKET